MRKAFVLAIKLNNDINSIGKQKSQREQPETKPNDNEWLNDAKQNDLMTKM